MNCPACGGKTEAIDSRQVSDYRRRRRQCVDCKERCTSIESVVENSRAGERLRRSLVNAFHISDEDIYRLRSGKPVLLVRYDSELMMIVPPAFAAAVAAQDRRQEVEDAVVGA